jgi:hypothetical protein
LWTARAYSQHGTIPVGSKVKFANEKQRYTVRASNERYAVCTKPFNARKTVLYTIIDFCERERGAENLIFEAGAETDAQCTEMLQRITVGETEISHRNRCELDIEEITEVIKDETE